MAIIENLIPDQPPGMDTARISSHPETLQIISAEDILNTKTPEWQALVAENRRLQELASRFDEMDALAKLSQIRRGPLIIQAVLRMYEWPIIGARIARNLRDFNRLITQPSETIPA